MPLTPGMDEARLDAIRSVMTSNIATLQAALTGLTPALSGITITAGQFFIGDPDTLPTPSETFPFWVCVIGGGKQDGQDWESRQEFIHDNIFHHRVFTNIYFYIHPDTFTGSGFDGFVQAEYRERLRARFCDWARLVCFNNRAALSITLASNEYTNPSGVDHLDNGYIHEIYKGFVPKSFGTTQWVYSAHLVHEAEIV